MVTVGHGRRCVSMTSLFKKGSMVKNKKNSISNKKLIEKQTLKKRARVEMGVGIVVDPSRASLSRNTERWCATVVFLGFYCYLQNTILHQGPGQKY